MKNNEGKEKLRLDKYLWAIRLFKTKDHGGSSLRYK